MHTDHSRSFVVLVALAVAALVLMPALYAAPVVATARSGNVYSSTNEPTGNAIVIFHRDADGRLSLAGRVPTGGEGDGTGPDPLESQGAVSLDQSGRWLFAVNAGSSDVSVFRVDGDRLELADRVASGGTRPVSVAVHGSLVYVLNTGFTPGVQGFVFNEVTQHLVALPGSRRDLAGAAAADPAEVSFSLDGGVLMVTEKGTATIDAYSVGDDGYLAGPLSNPSSGSTPFGFAFTHRRVAIVSEAGASNALSSYLAGDDGTLTLVTPSLQNGQQAVCWTVVTGDGRYAYTINAATATLSSYGVSPNGTLTLLDPAAGAAGGGSVLTDAALSADSRFLYVRDGALGRIHGFRVEADGSLTRISAIAGVPPGGQGLAAR
jgi:6-phosphogluconolactonase (cycloisomerase 2 family)